MGRVGGQAGAVGRWQRPQSPPAQEGRRQGKWGCGAGNQPPGAGRWVAPEGRGQVSARQLSEPFRRICKGLQGCRGAGVQGCKGRVVQWMGQGV